MNQNIKTGLVAAAVAAVVAPGVALATSFPDRIFAPGEDITSSDTTRTALGVRGVEAGLGTLKVSHDPSAAGATDPNASSVSIRQDGVDTQSQGIFSDAPDSCKALPMQFRFKGGTVFSVKPDTATTACDVRVDITGALYVNGTKVTP